MNLFPPLSLRLLVLAFAGSLNAAEPLAVRLSTNLEGRSGRSPLMAVDDDDATYFASRRPPKADDHFTVTLETPTRLKTVEVISGKPDGSERFADGAVEISEDGSAFVEVGSFREGVASCALPDKVVKALRVRVTKESGEPLTLREVRLADVKLAPAGRVQAERQLGSVTVRFLGDASLFTGDEQIRLTAFLEKAAAIYFEKLGDMAKRLEAPWEKVPKSLLVIYKANTGRGVPAFANGNAITLNSGHVLRDPADSVGMFIHELTHVVQQYPRGNPGWLVEGLSDLIRYELSPPEDAWVQRLEKIDRKKSDYRRAYSEAAKFLAWVQRTHAPGLEGKLSRAMQEGRYREELWTELAGKDLAALWAEYQEG